MQLESLVGTWHIIFTNFPMWLKGDKHAPEFHYDIEIRKGVKGLKDTVSYTQNHKVKKIRGWDQPINQTNTDFEWRGNGLLKLLKSHWEIMYINDQSTWMIIHFQKTLFTPEGYDVVHRNKVLNQQDLNNITDVLHQFNLVSELTQLP